MEIFDIVDEYGQPTGRTVERKEAHAKGIRHRTAHIWIVQKTGDRWQVLLQKRAQGKDSFPGCYDTSSAGHIQAGDEPRESALRELEEELGIRAAEEELEFADTFVIDYQTSFYGDFWYDREVAFVYIYRKPVNIEQLILQEEEVEEVRWFDLDDVHRALFPERDPRFCIPEEGFLVVENWCNKE